MFSYTNEFYGRYAGQFIQLLLQRGAVVEWLERLCHGADSRRNVVSSRLIFAI